VPHAFLKQKNGAASADLVFAGVELAEWTFPQHQIFVSNSVGKLPQPRFCKAAAVEESSFSVMQVHPGCTETSTGKKAEEGGLEWLVDEGKLPTRSNRFCPC
jgi:hypothetical protein